MSNPSANVLTVSIAGWPVTLELFPGSAPVQARLAERWRDFIVPPQPDSFSIRIQVEPGPPFIPLEPSGTWQVHTADRNGRVEFKSYFEMGWMDRRRQQGELLLRPDGDPENFLRVLYAWLCLDHHALLLHASGVIRNGRGYVFFGASGSGKTTVARLSLNDIVLSDDLVIIQPAAGTYRVYGVPFRGEMAEAPRTNASADLMALFSLCKDGAHRAERLGLPEAVGRLASAVPFIMQRAPQAQQVVAVCTDLAQHVPVYNLHFRQDRDFWEVIDGLA